MHSRAATLDLQVTTMYISTSRMVAKSKFASQIHSATGVPGAGLSDIVAVPGCFSALEQGLGLSAVLPPIRVPGQYGGSRRRLLKRSAQTPHKTSSTASCGHILRTCSPCSPCSSAKMASDDQPLLTYWDRNAPFGAVAVARFANTHLKHAAEPKGTKETVPTLKFPSG